MKKFLLFFAVIVFQSKGFAETNRVQEYYAFIDSSSIAYRSENYKQFIQLLVKATETGFCDLNRVYNDLFLMIEKIPSDKNNDYIQLVNQYICAIAQKGFKAVDKSGQSLW